MYRVLFHGAEGSGPVLLDLPAVRLPAPFAHVVLFGPITADGLWDAAASAVPIALTILAFGLLNSLVDLSRVFARASRRGPLRGIARALAVAWATLPALADAVRSVRFAQRLRGERAGVRMLSPVLERTLERATAVAAALEVRGFAGRSLAGSCEHPVELRDVRLRHGGHEIVRVDELTLTPGSLTLLAGSTGSGKSTLLRALAGLHTHVDGGEMDGTAMVVGHERRAVAPRDLAQRVGVVLQNPREAFATERVADEIGLALELRGVAPLIVAARVREVAGRVGIVPLLGRRLHGLSAGEATLVAIAAAIVEHPILLLVDEPLADLDADARRRITALLGALAHEAGICVIVAEHRVTDLGAVADTTLRIERGVLSPVALVERAAPESAHHPRPVERAAGETKRAEPPALTVDGLTVTRDSRTLVDDARFALAPGEIVALTGPNGAGKSTLLVGLAVPADEAPVTVAGDPSAVRRIALVPDASDDLFVFDTVAAECRRADRRSALTETTAERFARLLGLDETALARRAASHPRDLSMGERRCLALAVQTASAPAVLLVDEPTRGLDDDARALVASALGALAASGTAILIATHDADFAAAIGARVLPIREGRVGAPADRSTTQAERSETAPAAAVAPVQSELWTGPPPPVARTATPTTHRLPRLPHLGPLALVAANLVALAAFCWPLVAIALPEQAHAAVPYVAIALAPVAVVVVLAALDGTVRSAHTLALLGTLAAIGAAIRIVGTGVGGVEALFVLLILAGRAFGARFGLLLGALTIALSSVVWGGIGPWTPFQMFACAWVGAGAGLLTRRVRGRAEIGMLCAYGIVASYLFGFLMNMWFWPFAVGAGTGISYIPGGSIAENLASFFVYSLLTSTAGWDTLRAVTTVIGLLVVGRPVLAALRRAKPVRPRSAAEPVPYADPQAARVVA
ncbi:hypothetical protein Microterr_23260 [Microbacterium terricola]|uniref:ABC transporter domain-containing protein n=1 Tax=Microbacterium terricola TaxID=344163 RepID=A0ABM8E1K7_9MICO|nr:hypothetical protein Microterr_23260 [Microbacterium terricola]